MKMEGNEDFQTQPQCYLRNLSIKKISQLDPGFLLSRTLGIVSTLVFFLPAALIAQQYQQTNLVSDTLAEGTNPPDPNLKDAWGISRSTTSPWWVSDKMAGVSTLYNGSGVKTPLTVTIPHTAQTAIGSPTGQVFNGSNDFAVAPGKPGLFIFVSLDGTISAWNPGVNRTNAIQKVPGSTKSVLTGATIAEVELQRLFYVGDLGAWKITVYDTNFNPVEVGENEFDDKHGEHAFDAITGRFEGKFNDQNNKVMSIAGLWALEFGGGVPASDPPNQPDNALFFSAGPNKGHDGLFGTLTPVAAELTEGSDQ